MNALVDLVAGAGAAHINQAYEEGDDGAYDNPYRYCSVATALLAPCSLLLAPCSLLLANAMYSNIRRHLTINTRYMHCLLRTHARTLPKPTGDAVYAEADDTQGAKFAEFLNENAQSEGTEKLSEYSTSLF